MSMLPLSNGKRRARADPPTGPAPDGHGLLSEAAFVRALGLERKRTERSGRRFVLMVLQARESTADVDGDGRLAKAVPAVRATIRETDIAGWHKQDSALGVIFPEPGTADNQSALDALRSKTTAAVGSVLSAAEVAQLRMTFHCFPDEWKLDDPGQPIANLYPDLAERDAARRVARAIKRGIDVVGAALALVVFAPVLFAVAIAIKLTSPGPVLFRQKRIGQYGAPFTCLKFRSMHAVNDAQIHKDYVTSFITGCVEPQGSDGNGKVIYKLTKDPRLTPIGAFLRKTSLDEFPQFLNVLRGEMSLVGPRPPIPYELEAYDVWHRRRLLDVKPGITGLWQVNGRSRLRFDDMVRLDLRYATTWSVWLDIKILLRTPYAVFSGEGAH